MVRRGATIPQRSRALRSFIIMAIRQVFISHISKESALAQLLKERLLADSVPEPSGSTRSNGR
jgi:hypothetical protein